MTSMQDQKNSKGKKKMGPVKRILMIAGMSIGGAIVALYTYLLFTA